MKFIIERFEEYYDLVELEDKTLEDIPNILIPKDAKEGEVLKIKICI